MNSTGIPTILAFLLVLAVAGAALRFFQVRRTYYIGISLWSRWLPVVATGIYLGTLAMNLAADGQVDPGPLSLTGFFSTAEVIVLFLAGPLFLTRLGNIFGALTLAYCIERLVGSPGTAAIGSPALYLITGAAAVVTVLSDRMPWLQAEGFNAFAQKLREILLMSLTIGALVVVFAGIIRIHGFTRWVATSFGMSLPTTVMLVALTCLFVGWLSVALGFTRNFTIPLLSLPSLFVLAYVTDWPSYLLIVPFALFLSLSLASAERRAQRNRRHGGYVSSLIVGR